MLDIWNDHMHFYLSLLI